VVVVEKHPLGIDAVGVKIFNQPVACPVSGKNYTGLEAECVPMAVPYWMNVALDY